MDLSASLRSSHLIIGRDARMSRSPQLLFKTQDMECAPESTPGESIPLTGRALVAGSRQTLLDLDFPPIFRDPVDKWWHDEKYTFFPISKNFTSSVLRLTVSFGERKVRNKDKWDRSSAYYWLPNGSGTRKNHHYARWLMPPTFVMNWWWSPIASDKNSLHNGGFSQSSINILYLSASIKWFPQGSAIVDDWKITFIISSGSHNSLITTSLSFAYQIMIEFPNDRFNMQSAVSRLAVVSINFRGSIKYELKL